MTKELIQLQKLITSSHLSQEDQKDLMWVFSKANDEILKLTIELFQKDPSWIKKISDNYKAKKHAFEKKDKELWEKIIKEEIVELSKIQ